MKKSLLRLIIFLLLSVSMHAQNTTKNTENGQSPTAKKEVVQVPKKNSVPPTVTINDSTHPAKPALHKELPQLPLEWFQRLWDSCTVVDYTFFTMPITIALDQPGNVRSSLRHIGGGVVAQKADCQRFAKIFYQIKGQIVLSADVFLSENACSYVVYSINNTPSFANPISTEGLQFFNQLIERQKMKNH